MRLFEAIAETLVAKGVKAVFTLMSEDTARIIVATDARGIRAYATRHESAAIGMAHGYARASGSIGVAILGRGPGLTNGLTLLVNAAKDGAGTGLLVIAGDTAVKDVAADPPGAGQLKYIDQSGLLDTLGVHNVVIRSPDGAMADFIAACERADGGGTIVVNVPTDMVMQEVGPLPRAIRAATPEPTQPDPAAIAAVADLLEETWAVRRPLILAGRGAVLSGAGEALRGLGEQTGALLSTTLLAQSLFRDDPFDIGVLGTVARPAAAELAPQADCVLAFGTSLQTTTTWRGETFRNARLVHVDADPRAFGRSMRPDLAVHADARLAAVALRAELERRGHHTTGWRAPDLAKRLAALRVEGEPPGRGARLDPHDAMRALDRLLPRERAVIIETGQCLSFVAEHLSVPDPDSFFFPHGFGTIGASLGFALGVAVARPDRPTVYAGGDGSFMMTVADLDTAVRYRLPVIFVVCNDGGFGAEVQMLRVNGLDGELARYRNPSFVSIARAMGADGVTIASLADLEGLDTRLKGLSGPFVVDCLVDPDVQANWVEFFFRERHSPTAH